MHLLTADNSYLYKVNAYNVSQQIDRSGAISTLYITGPTVWNDFVYVTSGSTYYQFNASNLTQTYATFSVGSQSWNNPIIYEGYIYFASTSVNKLYKNKMDKPRWIMIFDGHSSEASLYTNLSDINDNKTIVKDATSLASLKISDIAEIIDAIMERTELMLVQFTSCYGGIIKLTELLEKLP